MVGWRRQSIAIFTRASIHRDGGPKTALNVINSAATASKDSSATSAIFDRFCFVIMFAPPTRECLHSPSSINARACVRIRTGRSQASPPSRWSKRRYESKAGKLRMSKCCPLCSESEHRATRRTCPLCARSGHERHLGAPVPQLPSRKA